MGASQTEQDNFNGKYVITTPKNTPENWICNQTYFRNHEAIEYTIQNYLQLHNITEAKLSIWIIGSGVIEPLVTCAILEKYRESGYLSDYEIICLDANHLVIEVLSSLIAGETFKVQLDGERIVTSHYTLYFAELAPLFSAPESATNPHLINVQRIVEQFNSLIKMEIGKWLGICHREVTKESAMLFLKKGIRMAPEMLANIRCFQSDILNLSHNNCPEEIDIAISNFALQYPIWAGKGSEAIRKVTQCFNAKTLFQHAATYSAQTSLFHLLDSNDLRSSFGLLEYAVREVDVAKYPIDKNSKTWRLRIRTDAIFGTLDVGKIYPERMRLLTTFAERHGGNVREFADMKSLAAYMRAHDGVKSEEVVSFAYWNEATESIISYCINRDTLLRYGKLPLCFMPSIRFDRG